MTDLVTKLSGFGFSKTDALVYIELLKNGRASGYKIAKNISLARSTVYSSIDNLFNNGYIFMADGDIKEYEAKSPDLIFKKIEENAIKDIEFLKEELSSLANEQKKDFIYNISGHDHLLLKAKEMIEQSVSEVYLNTDFPLGFLKKEMKSAVARGVRVIVFSFNKVEVYDDNIETFSRFSVPEKDYPSHRFMLVVDMEQTLIFSHREKTNGLFTNNELMVKIIAEHIHGDIYLSHYERQHPDEKPSIHTIHEQYNAMVLDGLKKQL